MRSLRVLFLASRDWYHPGTTGGDNTLWENARYLASAGHSVTFVGALYPGAAASEVIDGINVVRLGRLHTLWFNSFVYYLRNRRRNFDVVVTEGFGGSRIPRLAPLYVREPIITEWHQVHRDLFAAQYPKPMLGMLNLLERITAFVHRDTLVRAGTDDWGKRFPEIGFKPANIVVVPVSIRDEWLHGPNGNAGNSPTLVWIGNFRRYKCPDHAILAMPEILRRVPSAQLVLIGRHDDLKYERDLKALADRLAVSHRVSFKFNVSEEVKRNLLTTSRALLVTSAVEGFGIVVLEANARGVPVIASSRVPEGAVRERHNGLRYPFGDIERLATLAADLLTDDELYKTLASNASRFAEQFTWAQVGARFEHIVYKAAGAELTSV